MAILWEAGTQGLEVQPGAPGCVVLLAYFPAGPALEQQLDQALAVIPTARIEAVSVPEVDWVAQVRQGFRPARVGCFLIAAPWHLPLSREAGETLLLVEPGRAFGTGTHESTRLCLRFLQEIAAHGRPRWTLDVGTGSGILAIAAALLCAHPVVAVDNDPDAIEGARHQARLNQVDIRLLLGDGARALAASAFDLVLANLSAPLLLERRDELARPLAAGGALVLAGFLAADLAEVQAAFASLGPGRSRTDGEWAALLVRKAA